jgi:hypothetical protein
MPLFQDTIQLGGAVVDQVVNAFALAGASIDVEAMDVDYLVRFGFFALCQPRGTNVTALEFTRAASIHSGRDSPPQPGAAKSEFALTKGHWAWSMRRELWVTSSLRRARSPQCPMAKGEKAKLRSPIFGYRYCRGERQWYQPIRRSYSSF